MWSKKVEQSNMLAKFTQNTIIVCQLCGADVTRLNPKRGCYNFYSVTNMCKRCFEERYPEISPSRLYGEMYVFDQECPKPKMGAVVT